MVCGPLAFGPIEVNTVPDMIPIVGDLVLGGHRLLAITARAIGRLSDPDVSANPASVVTPDFLRGFFALFQGSSRANSEQRPRQEWDIYSLSAIGCGLSKRPTASGGGHC